MNNLENILKKITEFRDERDWKQFHNSKDLALALSIEASELVEIFLWKGNEDFKKADLEEELADVLMYALLLADKNNLDVFEIIERKLKKNAEKYPVEKARGNAKKYDKL